MTEFTPLYAASHFISEGSINVDIPFTGNTLFVEIDFNTLLDRSNLKLGILYIYSGNISHAYRIDLKQSILSLPVSDITKIRFIPTLDLYALYTLTLNYATVGSVIDSPNAYPLPETITALPNRVDVLQGVAIEHSSRLDTIEEDLEAMVAPNWDNLSDKPSVFPPSTHNHSIDDINSLSLALNDLSLADMQTALEIDQLTGRVNILESNPVASSNSSIPLSVNTQLESSKSYLATTNNLVCSLPSDPSIGDAITLVNGNFSSFRINHGNSSQSILNNATLTTSGSSNNGIILKPYASITLVFMGAGLWVSTNRVRTINNWLNPTLEAVATSKPYTFVNQTINLTEMYDGNESTNTNANTNDGWASFSLSGSHFIDSLRVITGQSNGWFNYPTQLRVYSGSGVSGTLLGDFAITQETQIFTLPSPFEGNLITTRFSRSGSPMTVKDLKINTRTVAGGEISVM